MFKAPPEYEFRASAFPIIIEAYCLDTKKVVWSKTLELPVAGTQHALEIPPLRKMHNCLIGMRFKFADEAEWIEEKQLETVN